MQRGAGTGWGQMESLGKEATDASVWYRTGTPPAADGKGELFGEGGAGHWPLFTLLGS